MGAGGEAVDDDGGPSMDDAEAVVVGLPFEIGVGGWTVVHEEGMEGELVNTEVPWQAEGGRVAPCEVAEVLAPIDAVAVEGDKLVAPVEECAEGLGTELKKTLGVGHQQ